MLCAPLLNSLRSDSPTRADDTINRVSLEQLRAGILERCVSGRLTAPYVTLIDGTMNHPLRHFFSHRLPRAAHVSCNGKGEPRTARRGSPSSPD
jgi:hypothetical protein